MKHGFYSQRCWIEGEWQAATIWTENGKIAAIELDVRTPDAEDWGNAVIMPGVLDAHVHVNEPGRTEWEGFETATRAAAAGGITTLVDMPLNASPVTTTLAAWHTKLAATEGKRHVNLGFYGGLIPGNLNEVEGLIQAGALGIKAFLVHSGIDEFLNATPADLNAVMPILARLDAPLLVHCEIPTAEGGFSPDADPRSYADYLASRPPSWEVFAIRTVLELCARHQCRTHIVHVAAADALPYIASAKFAELPVTAETCPHYLFFAAESIPDGETIYKCAPPIRENVHQQQLKSALQTGILDFVASDHSPAPPNVKALEEGNFQTGWGGIAGLQTLLSASWTALKSELSLEDVIPLLTEYPAEFLGLDDRKGYIKTGYDADLVIWEPETNFELTPDALFHRHKISPYLHQNLSGKVRQTIVNGMPVFRDGAFLSENQGQICRRTPA